MGLMGDDAAHAHVAPMYTPRPIELADCWHAVRSPGGYERWYFDAEDDAQDVRVVAILSEGFGPGYLREYFRYLRRPTRKAPPVASDYAGAYFAVYEKGRLAHQFVTQVMPEAFSASGERVEVTAGQSRLRSDGGVLRLGMAGTGPRSVGDPKLSATLEFRPELSHPPVERVSPSRRMTGAEHHWVIANPMCRVSGSIEVRRGAEVVRSLSINGRGYHDHNYGTAPPGPGLRRWMRGRMIADGRVWTFHLVEGWQGGQEVHLVMGDDQGMREVTLGGAAAATWDRSSRLLKYPSQVALGDELVLERPRLVDGASYDMRLIYEARGRGATGTAFCEVSYPHRLRWPMLGRMIETSIRRE
jgi:carotenoid 1,2-hydratase